MDNNFLLFCDMDLAQTGARNRRLWICVLVGGPVGPPCVGGAVVNPRLGSDSDCDILLLFCNNLLSPSPGLLPPPS